MRTPRMYFHSRFSTSARVAALIIPRSATMQTEPIPNRVFNRSTMGTRLFTSAVLPGQSSLQHGEEDGPLDRKLEAPAFEQGGQDFVDRAGLPESLEDQGRPDPGAARGDAVTACMGAEDGEFFGEPSQRPDQRVEPAAGQQLIEATETKQDVLLDLAVHPVVIHDEQIGSRTVGLRANEQVGAPVSLSWMTLRRITSIISSYLQIR